MNVQMASPMMYQRLAMIRKFTSWPVERYQQSTRFAVAALDIRAGTEAEEQSASSAASARE